MIVICDIDGTLSNPGERLKFQNQSPPDWESYYSDGFEDEPIKPITNMINLLAAEHLIYFLTARSERVRQKTNLWIRKNIPWFNEVKESTLDYFLYMRSDEDERPSYIVKPDLLKSLFKGVGFKKKDILFMVEDNNKVCDTWRDLGYTCLQVAENDF